MAGALVVLASASCARVRLDADGGARSRGGQDDAALPREAGMAEDGGASEDAAVDPLEDATVAPMDATPDAVEAADASGPDAAADAGEPTCVPGTYEGTFDGNIRVLGLSLFRIAGNIEIRVDSADDGDRLSIRSGSIDGSDQNGNPVRADVLGVLNCSTLKLEGGALRNGTYRRSSINMTVRFEGTVEADYHPGPKPEVTGVWRTDGGFESGEGKFQATLRAP